MNRYASWLRASLLILYILLSLAACGNDTTATTMRLQRTKGTVAVSDDKGKDVPLLEGLGLYSGYGVNTQSESYAWINLDDVKLAKMDQGSEITIQKVKKALEIEVKSGCLFFSVTQPLEDDETMDIRTSTMLIGIRGTCGWMEDRDGLSRVCLLEGMVECTAGSQTVQVNAGETAELTADGKLTVTAMTVQDIPVFVLKDLTLDPGLSSAIYEVSGLDVLGTSETAGGQGETKEASNESEGDVTWSYNDGVLTFSGSGSMDDYYLASLQPWSGYRKQIHTVIIGNGVTSIGENAFEGCDNLTSVTIPNSVTSIGSFAFISCSSLTSVTIPNSVTDIGENAFASCGSLTSVTIPNSVTSIGDFAFESCGSLTSATIPNSVTRIGDFAFESCGSLTSVTIPNSVTSIGDYAFAVCSNLTSVTIPNGVISIGEGAFQSCSNLTSVTIPDSVASIGYAAFFYCDSLKDVYYGGSEIQWGQIVIERSNGPLFDATIYYQ